MRRLFLNSKVFICPEDTPITTNDKLFIIQIEKIGNYYVIEYCEVEDICELIGFDSVVKSGYTPASVKQSDQDKIAEYRAIVLNKDPFAKYSGKTLGEIIDSNDEAWYSKVVSQMRNEFIRTRLQYLHDHKSEDDGLPF